MMVGILVSTGELDGGISDGGRRSVFDDIVGDRLTGRRRRRPTDPV